MFVSRVIQIIAAMTLMLVPAIAAPVTISGDVLYRERIALPAGVTLRVNLVSLTDGKVIVGASQSISTKSQSPLAFTLSVRSKLDSAAAQYGLIAEIRSGDNLIYKNPTPVAVDLAVADRVEILVHRVAVQPVPTPSEPVLPALDPLLLGRQWQVTSIGGKPVSGTQAPTLTIQSDLRTSGFGGCNRYFTEASIEGAALTFGPTAATRMACPPPAMIEETSFFAALAAVSQYEVTNESLRLLDAAGVPLIGLVPAKEQ